MKVYEIAKEYGVTSKDILALLSENNIETKSHLSKLTPEGKKIVDAKFASEGKVDSVKAKDSSKKEDVNKNKVEKGKPSAEVVEKKALKKDKKTEKKVVPIQKQKIEKQPDKKIAFKVKTKEPVEEKSRKRSEPERIIVKKKTDKKGFNRNKFGKKVFDESENGNVVAVKEVSKTSLRADRERPELIKLKFPISVGALATNLAVKTSELIKALMQIGIFATVNQLLDEELAVKVSEKFNVLVEKLPSEEEKLIFEAEKKDKDEHLESRPPVVTMMGHVDHGKTSLLDAIRKSNVADREAGNITQHIGAYEVLIPGKGKVAFLDTPGHAAFTAMRARGANVTDIVVIVVAADDGVMPQTVEAIDHAKAAETPILVAINKCDLPGANPDKVKAELQQHDLTPEDWGGKTIMVNVSAKTGEGVDDLLELLLLESEILELKANPKRAAQGTLLEGMLSKSLGSVATLLVENGTLNIGDCIVCGQYYGRVRAMRNDKRKKVKDAGPSTPLEVLGLNGVPSAGERFYVVDDEKQARSIAEKRRMQIKEKSLSGNVAHMSLEGLYEQIKDSAMKELKIIVKADVQGSVQVIKESLEKLSNDKIKLKVIHGGVGGINDSDVMLAAASDAIIIGFHVKATSNAESLIVREKVDVKYYKIIYEAINDVKLAMEGLLDPTIQEVNVGHAEVQQMFKASKVGNIAGCIVRKGKLVRNNFVRLVRDDIVVFDGKFASLKRFKDDVKEVAEGYDCGVVLDKYSDVKPGDIIECYKEEKIAAKL